MDASVAKTGTEGNIWGGGQRPMGASYGKLMMWIFLASDSLTFTGFLAAYGMQRFKFLDIWPIADEVFNEVPFLDGVDLPMIFPAFMTFLLIFSSVTMVLAVNAGKYMDRKKVTLYMSLTILGGFIFLGSQAFEWAGFIKGHHGAVETHGRKIVQVFNTDGERITLRDIAVPLGIERETLERHKGTWFSEERPLPTVSIDEVKAGFQADESLLIRLPNYDEKDQKIMLSREESLAFMKNEAAGVVEGANLKKNEYGPPLFANFFFFITGFHGFHVSIGLLLLIVTFTNVLLGTYEKRKSYEMVEKVGLYWHFVDLVWVFVFTFFYLV